MNVGTAWEEITPSRPLPLMGQMHERLGEHVRDPLTVNSVVFDDGKGRVALVSVDVCYLPDDLLERARKACASTCGLPIEAVLIAATHTHVAPCTSDRLAGRADPEFISRLNEAVVQAVGRAIEDLEPVDLFAGTGYLAQMGWNRRGLRQDGSCHMYWGSWREDFVGLEGPRDGEVGVIHARRPDGKVKVVIPSFSTHPNCLEGGRFYSADIPGEVRRVLKAALGEHLGVVYLTAAAGNTAPSIMENNPENIQPWRGESGLERSGQYLGGEILKVIAEGDSPMSDPVLRPAFEAIDIPMREWDASADLSAFKGGMLEFFEKSRADWGRLMREDNPVHVRLHVIRIGDAAICTNPAELYCEFGLAIKANSPAQVTLIAELTDGALGYVPTPQAIRHGGYSALSASHTRLVPEGGWMIVDATRRHLERVFDTEA